jgi:hypothetical protein
MGFFERRTSVRDVALPALAFHQLYEERIPEQTSPEHSNIFERIHQNIRQDDAVVVQGVQGAHLLAFFPLGQSMDCAAYYLYVPLRQLSQPDEHWLMSGLPDLVFHTNLELEDY